jgi:hypothetical protein
MTVEEWIKNKLSNLCVNDAQNEDRVTQFQWESVNDKCDAQDNFLKLLKHVSKHLASKGFT